MNTGRLTQGGPVVHRLMRDGTVVRYERLPTGRLRRLIEDEWSDAGPIDIDCTDIELRLAVLR